MQLPSLFKTGRTYKNILPRGGEAIYHGVILKESDADALFNLLLHSVPWRKSEGIMYDKYYVTERKIAWYGERDPWPPELLRLKRRIEEVTGLKYSHVLLNLYKSGEVGLGMHSDKEAWEKDASIASISLGAERRFDFQHNTTKEIISIILEHGSLLVMNEDVQHFWKHGLPKTKQVLHPRINLTFRNP